MKTSKMTRKMKSVEGTDMGTKAPPWLGESGVDNGEREGTSWFGERRRGQADTSKETGEVGCRVGSGEGRLRLLYCEASQQHAPPGLGGTRPLERGGLARSGRADWSEHLVGASGPSRCSGFGLVRVRVTGLGFGLLGLLG